MNYNHYYEDQNYQLFLENILLIIFLIIFWPFLWESPLENLALSFKYFSYMKGWNVKVFFNV